MHYGSESPIPIDQRCEDRSLQHHLIDLLLHMRHQGELRPETQSGHVVMTQEVRELGEPVEHPQFVNRGRLEVIWLHLHRQCR